MSIEEVYKKLTTDIPNVKIYLNEPMSKHTSFKIGGNADIFIKVKNVEEIEYILKLTKEENIPLTTIGNGSNILVRDNGIRGITMQIDIQNTEIKDNTDEFLVIAGAGVKLAMLAVVLQRKGIAGFEFASGIPGTIGGAVRMNAGAYGKEMKDIIIEVTYITKDGKIEIAKMDDLDFSYRHSRFCNSNEIILNATIKLSKGNIEEIKETMQELLQSRKEKQPIEFPSAGSTFKRGEDFITAKLIDEAGLKGYKMGGAQISTKHAGFVINAENATAEDVLKLVQYVKDTVKEKFDKNIELEIEVIGE